jgi:pimeloyl-ACP methyl ester carboxylesterase
MATRKPKAGSEAAQLRRMYVDCRFGQLHLTTAYPPNGGFDERTALLLLHGDDGNGAGFNRCAILLGADRSVYAPDLPGSGASDGPAGRATVANSVAAIADLLTQLRLREIDVLGSGRGAQIAYELAAAQPSEVRRLITAGPQAPAAATAKPSLHLSGEPVNCEPEIAEFLVGEIRAFLDRDG